MPAKKQKSKKGRPSVGRDTVILTIRLPVQTRERLRKAADADRRASGTLAAILIEQGLDQIEKKELRQ